MIISPLHVLSFAVLLLQLELQFICEPLHHCCSYLCVFYFFTQNQTEVFLYYNYFKSGTVKGVVS